MTIAKLLEEISVIPGVSGSCIYNPETGPRDINLTMDIPETSLDKAGSSISRMLKMGKMYGLDIGGCRYRFDNCTILVTPLRTSAVLMTICTTAVNCTLAMSTSAMLADDISKLLEQEDCQSIEPTAEIDGDIETIDIEELPGSLTEIQGFLNQIKDALAEAIGPVAGMIMEDTIAQWQKQGPPIRSRLHELATMLSSEIDDKEHSRNFIARIHKIL